VEKLQNVSSLMHIEVISMIYEVTEQALRIDKFTSILRVAGSVELPPKLYCCNVLAVLYSYDNKECVHTKHIMINIRFVL
jgi:hypothetical protein